MTETASLVRRARRTDGDAVAELISRYELAIRSYAAKVAPRPDMGEDIAQEAFLRALANLDKFRVNEDFGLWVRGIVRNVARGMWDKLYRDRKIARDNLAEYVQELAGRYHEADDADVRQHYLEALRRCMQKLTSKGAELVKLRYHLNMRCAEIADRIESSSAAVKMALMRIRNGLRKCIRQQVKESPGAV
jgi:RNA polymerase sigma-70 factor